MPDQKKVIPTLVGTSPSSTLHPPRRRERARRRRDRRDRACRADVQLCVPPQLVQDVPYQDLGDMHVFARRWRERQRGKWFAVPKLSGFCLLMKRLVYDAIGGLDERFGLGFFDDDDLAERARRAGFELAVAYDLFVHHFGSRTFVGNRIDASRLLDENAARFAAKWGESVERGRRVGLRPWTGAEGGRENGGRADGVHNPVPLSKACAERRDSASPGMEGPLRSADRRGCR